MRALRKLNPGDKGTKKFMARYREPLNSLQRLWEIQYNQAVALVLTAWMVKLEVSDSRYSMVANTRHR